MSDFTVEQRVERARQEIEYYKTHLVGETFEDSSSDAVDLVADIMHYCQAVDQGHEPIDSLVRVARMHFDAEQSEEV